MITKDVSTYLRPELQEFAIRLEAWLRENEPDPDKGYRNQIAGHLYEGLATECSMLEYARGSHDLLEKATCVAAYAFMIQDVRSGSAPEGPDAPSETETAPQCLGVVALVPTPGCEGKLEAIEGADGFIWLRRKSLQKTYDWLKISMESAGKLAVIFAPYMTEANKPESTDALPALIVELASAVYGHDVRSVTLKIEREYGGDWCATITRLTSIVLHTIVRSTAARAIRDLATELHELAAKKEIELEQQLSGLRRLRERNL